MPSAFRVFTALLLAGLLSSCWIPEKFKATVSVNKDGSYVYAYDGVLAFAPFLAAAAEKKLTPKDEAAAQDMVAKLRQAEGFQKVDYLGQGRYQVVVRLQRQAGEATYFVAKQQRLFSIVPQRDGSLKVSSFKLRPRDVQQLSAIGARVEGELDVNVARGVRVVSQNADAVPRFAGLVGDYNWHIRSPAVAPEIVLMPGG